MVEIKTRITFVYGEAQVPERYKTWDKLRSIVNASSLPWAAMGDFNEVLHAHEHDGVGNRSQAQMDAFRDALDTCGLSDLGYKGNPWTFEKKVAGGSFTRVRLDRALGTTEWCTLFPNAAVEHLSAATSDHSPILVHLATNSP